MLRQVLLARQRQGQAAAGGERAANKDAACYIKQWTAILAMWDNDRISPHEMFGILRINKKPGVSFDKRDSFSVSCDSHTYDLSSGKVNILLSKAAVN